MTIGFLLIFVGIQLNLVDSFVLTSEATKFWHERIVDPANELVTDSGAGYPANGYGSAGQYQQQQPSPFQSPYFQASWNGNNPQAQGYQQQSFAGAPKILTPPSWICWPVFFAGTVFFLHGLSMRQ